jgi:cytochrome c oxidase assembly protein subunit 15
MILAPKRISGEGLFAGLAGVTAGLTLLLIVLGAWVRLTDADTACGNQWLSCNNRLFPSIEDDLAWIDWGHRLTTLLVGGSLLLTFVIARRAVAHRQDVVNPIHLAMSLLILQSLLGAATTWNWLSTLPLLHMAFAVIMLSCLIASLTMLLYSPQPKPYSSPADTFPAAVHAATLMTFMVLMTGAMVVGDDAAQACRGFPWCNHELDGSAILNLIHRGSVLLLGVVLVALAWRARTERPTDHGVNLGIFILLGLFIIQALIGAVYVQYGYKTLWSVLHVLFAGLSWGAAVALSITLIKQQAEFQ